MMSMIYRRHGYTDLAQVDMYVGINMLVSKLVRSLLSSLAAAFPLCRTSGHDVEVNTSLQCMYFYICFVSYSMLNILEVSTLSYGQRLLFGCALRYHQHVGRAEKMHVQTRRIVTSLSSSVAPSTNNSKLQLQRKSIRASIR